MAQETDSFYYDENDLEVFLFGLDDESDTIQKIELSYQLTNNRFNSGFDTIFQQIIQLSI